MRNCLAAVSVLFTAGCSGLSLPPVLPILPTDGFNARTLDNPRLKKFMEECLRSDVAPWPPASWDISTLTMAAWFYHPDLDIARAQLEGAQAGVKTASRIPNPAADSRYQYVSNADSGMSRTVLDSSVLFPVEAPGKRRSRIARAEHLTEAARLSIERAGWEIRGRVRSAVLDIIDADALAALWRRERDLREENACLLDRRAAEGKTSPLESASARVSLGEAGISWETARRQAVDARLRLAAALFVPPASVESVSISCAPPAEGAISAPRGEMQKTALRARCDMLVSLEEYAASQAVLQGELAARIPDIQLGPGYEWDQGADKWGISASLPLPIFDQNRGPIAEAKARVREAAARCVALQSRIIGDIDGALAAYAAARGEFEAAQSILAHQERQLAFLSAMTRAGEVQRIALLNARQHQLAAARTAIEARGRLFRAAGQIEDAVQQPLFAPSTLPPAPGLLTRAPGGR